MMKMLLLFVTISMASSEMSRPRRAVQNCGNSICNQNNVGLSFGNFGFSGVPLEFVPSEGGVNPQNCFGGRCNQYNFGWRKKRRAQCHGYPTVCTGDRPYIYPYFPYLSLPFNKEHKEDESKSLFRGPKDDSK